MPRPAQRVVSLGYTSHDPLLALGVRPVAVRHWFGAFPYGVWPWAQRQLGDATPDVLTGEVSMERVASLNPDLIVAIGAGISKAEYTVLSRIAPVLVHEATDSTYGTPWDRMTLTLGRATGRLAQAQELMAGVRAAFADARRRHPASAGKTGVAAYHWSGETGAFIGADTRARFLVELGFRPTDAVAALSGVNDFYAPLSPEDLSPLDGDLLLWVSSFQTSPDLVALPMRQTLEACREGREVFAGGVLAAALSFGSVLSLPFALNALEDDIAAAIDGDPATPVASAREAGLAP
ncbi:ABC transporter substrate-binding protein [Thalassobaculum salexigens]|uniref:ABC transporter substrate-binding protein n=1 Tax=Thalassobaculum salexigens TaxID=455360 RepID=UPI0003FD5EF2|nr:ABC transporter substrate-binding protein [Thalassobaculum salexigens]